MLLGIHVGLATLTGCPEFLMEESEAAQESDAIKFWAETEGKVVDPKTMARLNLIGTIGFIEGTRIFAILTRLRDEKKERAKQAPPVAGAAPGPQLVKTETKTDAKPPQRPSDMFGAAAYTLNPVAD